MPNPRGAAQQQHRNQSKYNSEVHKDGRDTSGKDSKENDEEKKMEDALSSAIVREKPNVKWADVAGLDQAKASL